MTRRELMAAAALALVPVSAATSEPEDEMVEVEIVPVDGLRWLTEDENRHMLHISDKVSIAGTVTSVHIDDNGFVTIEV